LVHIELDILGYLRIEFVLILRIHQLVEDWLEKSEGAWFLLKDVRSSSWTFTLWHWCYVIIYYF
jgi:hypothetical protein